MASSSIQQVCRNSWRTGKTSGLNTSHWASEHRRELRRGGALRTIVARFLCVLALVFAVGSPPVFAAYMAPESIVGAPTITAAELIELAVTTNGLVVIDARKFADWEDGYIDGAIHMVNTEMTPDALAVIVKRDQPVIFYCNGPNCYRSGDASTKAVQWGWRQVYWFRGGIEEWVAEGFPLTK